MLFGALSIIGIIAIQAYLVLTTWNLEESRFHEKARIALINVAKELAALSDYPLPSQNLVNQIGPDYYVININNVIDANNLDYFLQKELEAVALNEDYEYGIYDCANREMVYGRYVNYPIAESKEVVEKEKLPTYDEFEYYFGVRFPNRTSYVLGNMKLTIIFSIILFITILFFLYAIFVILRQKLLSEMQKDFINNMTHEFKTPISTIKIGANVFINNDSIKQNDRLLRYAHIISNQNDRLNNQVEKVLQLAKIERDSFKLKLETIDLHEVIRQTVNSIEMKIQADGGRIQTNLLAEHSFLKADALHLNNILNNLLDNAVKYCKGTPDIEVSTYNKRQKLILIVKDKGIGISKEYQAKVFKKFFRVPTGNVHNVKGFGLGLFYVKNIVDEHGWKIKLDSEEGKGTTLIIAMKYKIKNS